MKRMRENEANWKMRIVRECMSIAVSPNYFDNSIIGCVGLPFSDLDRLIIEFLTKIWYYISEHNW